MYPGMTITIKGASYIVPPLSLGQLRNGTMTKLKEHDVLVAQDKHFEAAVMRGEIIAEAIKRNYPDFDAQLLYDYLDLKNTSEIWLIVLGASGFTPGEDQAVTAEISGT